MTDPITRLNAALEGRYAIERELGEGGMRTVYLADRYYIPHVNATSVPLHQGASGWYDE